MHPATDGVKNGIGQIMMDGLSVAINLIVFSGAFIFIGNVSYVLMLMRSLRNASSNKQMPP